MSDSAPTPGVFDFVTRRAQTLATHIRARGLDLGSTEGGLLRSCVRGLGDGLTLALDADAPGLPAPIVSEQECSARFPISTINRDRMGDFVLPRGCLGTLQKNYARNPRVFFSHNTRSLPIGSARHPDGSVAVEVQDQTIWSKVYFHCQSDESTQIFHLVALKELQAASIGFLPLKAAVVHVSKESERPETNEFGEDLIYFEDGSPFFPCLRFHEWDLTEWSVVPVPANADCISMHLSRGSIAGRPLSEPLKRALEPWRLPRKAWSPGSALEQVPPPPPVAPGPGDSLQLKEGPAMDPLVAPPQANDPSKPVEPSLLGVKFLKDCLGRMKDWQAAIDEALQVLEQPKVKRYGQKRAARLAKEHHKACQLGHALYPEHFDDPGEGPEKTSPEPTVKDLGSVSEPPLAPAGLGGDPVVTPVVTPTEPVQLSVTDPAPPAVDWSLVLGAIQRIESTQARLQESWFEMTGERV